MNSADFLLGKTFIRLTCFPQTHDICQHLSEYPHRADSRARLRVRFWSYLGTPGTYSRFEPVISQPSGNFGLYAVSTRYGYSVVVLLGTTTERGIALKSPEEGRQGTGGDICVLTLWSLFGMVVDGEYLSIATITSLVEDCESTPTPYGVWDKDVTAPALQKRSQSLSVLRCGYVGENLSRRKESYIPLQDRTKAKGNKVSGWTPDPARSDHGDAKRETMDCSSKKILWEIPKKWTSGWTSVGAAIGLCGGNELETGSGVLEAGLERPRRVCKLSLVGLSIIKFCSVCSDCNWSTQKRKQHHEAKNGGQSFSGTSWRRFHRSHELRYTAAATCYRNQCRRTCDGQEWCLEVKRPG
nr:hypothetical protein CFP56_52829 [Quercus suber]